MTSPNRPLRFPQVFEVTKRSAAGTQLETAIRLWFEEKDRASIHTLAIAASGILNQMCKEREITSSEINDLIKAQPEAFRDIMRSAQNFFKHGRHKVRKWKGMVLLVPEFTELVLIDCLSMHYRLFDTLSPLMRLFGFRYNLFNPKAFPMQMTLKGIKVEDLRRFTRAEFLEKVLPRLRVQLGKVPPTS
jgi:hypothetical protein